MVEGKFAFDKDSEAGFVLQDPPTASMRILVELSPVDIFI